MALLASVTLTPREAFVRGLSALSQMKLLGFLILPAGWGIVVTAVALLAGAPRSVFVFAGLGVEALGLALVIRAHPIQRAEHN
jgi:uncharacterized membrane protein